MICGWWWLAISGPNLCLLALFKIFISIQHINKCQTFVTITRKTIVNKLRLIPSCQRPDQHKDTRLRHDLVVLCLQAGGKKPRPSEKLAHMQTSLHLGMTNLVNTAGPPALTEFNLHLLVNLLFQWIWGFTYPAKTAGMRHIDQLKKGESPILPYIEVNQSISVDRNQVGLDSDSAG